MEPITNREIQQQLLATFDDLVSLLGTVGHPKRLRILISLLEGPQTFKGLRAETTLQKSALASHLAKLGEKGLIQKISHGTYELADAGRSYLLVLAQFFGSPEDLEMSLQRMRGARSFLGRRDD
ncbi:MAG: ArsR family transcriptional regulator [Promethearchaeota archaeon]